MLLGGHTVADQEIKFGYAVTGEIDPARMLTNAGARAGDGLVLTKPLGTGMIATAAKFQRATLAQNGGRAASMRRFNRDAAGVIRRRGSRCRERVYRRDRLRARRVTRRDGVGERGDAGRSNRRASRALRAPSNCRAANVPGGGRTNESTSVRGSSEDASVDAARRRVAFDPQTSGGLLIAVDPAHIEDVVARLEAAGIQPARIGHVERSKNDVLVRLT